MLQKLSNGKSPRDVKKTVIFYQYCITNCSRILLNQNSKMMIELEFQKMILRSEKVTSHVLQMKFLKFRQYLQKNLLHISSKISKKKKLWENFMKNS